MIGRYWQSWTSQKPKARLRGAGFLALALMLGLSACGGGSSNEPYRAPVLNYGMHGGAGSAGIHTVAATDTVWNISQRYNLSMQDVIKKNHLRPPYMLAVGQRLVLPPPRTYVVKSGDTLYGVSRTFGVSQTQLARLNHLGAPYVIHRDEKLKLPSVSSNSARHIQVAAAKPSHKPYISSGSNSAVRPEQKPSASVRKASFKLPSKTPARSSSKFAWPVHGTVISTYGAKKDGLHNDGINIKAARGAPVRAAENGVVVYADNELKGYGNLILIRHADRWMTAYAHLDGYAVKKGDVVKRGQIIGRVGSTGGVSTPQLHFEIRRSTDAVNPQPYLAPQSI